MSISFIKKVFLVILLLPNALSAMSGGGGGNTLVVDANPECNSWGCKSCEAGMSNDNPYATIQAAVNAANSGDTISICDATYNENVTVSTDNLTIGKSDDAAGDVIVKNSNSVFKINGVNTLTLYLLHIEQTSHKAAISINSYSQKIALANLSIKSQNGVGIETNGGNEEITVSHTSIVTGDDGIDFNDDINGGVIIQDSNISATNKGITANAKVNGGFSMENVIINSDTVGIDFDDTINNGLKITSSIIEAQTFAIRANKTINGDVEVSDLNATSITSEAITFQTLNDKLTISNNTILSAKLYALKLNKVVNGAILISDATMTSTDSGAIKLYKSTNNGFEITNTQLSAGDKGLEFEDDLNGDIKIENISINSTNDGIDFGAKINDGVNIKSSDINSTDAKGIDFNDDIDGDCKIDDVNITAKERALYFNDKQITPTISNSNILSSGGDAIYTKNKNWTKFTLKDSCVESAANGKNALWINNKSTNAEVSGNCFYATAVNKLAKAKKDGNSVSGNYWDQNSGDYTQNKISDTSTLASCSLSCGHSIVLPNIVDEWRLDECLWDGTTGEVNDSISSINGSAVNGAITDNNGKICRNGVFDGDNDYVELPNFPDMTEDFSITAWFKTENKAEGGQRVFADDETSDNGYAISVGDGGSGKVRFYDRSQSGAGVIDTNAVVENNQWYFVAALNDKTNAMRHLYVYDANGNQLDHKTSAINADRGSNSGMASIGGETDSGETNNRFRGNLDEIKIFNGVVNETQLQEICDNERAGKNYDGSERTCGSCEVDTNQNYKFDAWDIFRDINDRNISTKIVYQDFNLTIASLNETNDNYQEFNGTVCTQIDGTTTWSKSDFRDQNTTTVNYTTIASAMKDTNVTIIWKKDVDENCPLTNEDNSTKATDNLAIRPDEFNITTYISLRAGEMFDFNVSANAQDYNETVDVSTTLFDSSKNCENNTSDFNITSVTFSNGESNNTAKFGDVGKVDINITDKNFASVDNDDTPQSCDGNSTVPHGAYICSNDVNITIYPYKFEIKNYFFTRNNPEADWRYMSDVNESNITISFKVQAQNMDGNVTQNFDASCYAGDVNASIHFNFTSSDDVNISYYREMNNTSSSGQDINISDINWTGTINDQNFTDGNSSKVVYALNIYREFDKPKNPLDINVSDINTTYNSNTNVKNIGLSPENNDSTFYYGRIRADDIITQKTSVTHFAEIEVYDATGSNYVDGFKQNSLKWYRNTNHNSPLSDIIDINGTKDSTLDSGDINISDSNLTKGKVDFNIDNNTTGSYYMHIKTKDWLWYIPSAYGGDYNDSVGSNCTTHPCFNYTLENSSTSHTISSGDFKGTDYTLPSRGDYEKTGVKVYR